MTIYFLLCFYAWKIRFFFTEKLRTGNKEKNKQIGVNQERKAWATDYMKRQGIEEQHFT